MDKIKVTIKNTNKTAFYALTGVKIDPGKEITTSIFKWQESRLKGHKGLLVQEVSDAKEVSEDQADQETIENLDSDKEVEKDQEDKKDEDQSESSADQEDSKDALICKKCGKEYQKEVFYNRHIETCGIDTD